MSHNADQFPIQNLVAQSAVAVQEMLDTILAIPRDSESRLLNAMRYASLGNGKRIRPFLAVQSGRLFDVPESQLLRSAAAIELIHCYSLIHDDLPAMDNDDMRRGKPSCHIKFDEATAILAGDALQAIAYEVLADPETHRNSDIRTALIKGLAVASGSRGMVEGQMIDLVSEHNVINVSTLTKMQRLKTGALISFSCESGAIIGGASDNAKTALLNFSYDLGLAFQITDDLLDELGSAEIMGKATQKDAAAGKATFVTLLGVKEAQNKAKLLIEQSITHLDIFGKKAAHLRSLAKFVVERQT